MHSEKRVPTPYGPIDVPVVSCDGPQCTALVMEPYMVGWHKLGPQGIEAATFATHPDPLDFCSLTCAKASIDLMTGNS